MQPYAPNPLQLPGHLHAWERYLHSNDVDPLLQAAIAHAQFEILHPFTDGNGRIGRLLIPLFLHSKGRLSSPMFHLSAYLEAKRADYYARLAAITRDKDWSGWTASFLRAIAEQAKPHSVRVQAILPTIETP